MTATKATAPSRTPRRQREGSPAVPTPAGPARRHLRSVPAVEDGRLRTRPRVHIVIGFGVGSLFTVLFAVAVLQTVLVQGQIRLDDLQTEVAEAEVQAQALRAEVAELESPTRVIEAAEAGGLVPATEVRSVVPARGGGTPAP